MSRAYVHLCLPGASSSIHPYTGTTGESVGLSHSFFPPLPPAEHLHKKRLSSLERLLHRRLYWHNHTKYLPPLPDVFSMYTAPFCSVMPQRTALSSLSTVKRRGGFSPLNERIRRSTYVRRPSSKKGGPRHGGVQAGRGSSRITFALTTTFAA